ncbi:MAG: GerMN domain-containing protein, partial [Spirochaetaceae bacterium]|nr:GerMN domain-containing protein [Spirochaetaceae bacterium]
RRPAPLPGGGRGGGGGPGRRARGGGPGRRPPGRKRTSAPGVSVGYLFGTAVVLLVLTVFLINRIAIRDVMERTELVEVLQRRMDGAAGREQPAPLPPVYPAPVAGPAPRTSPDSQPASPVATPRGRPAPVAPRAEAVPDTAPAATDTAPAPTPAPETVAPRPAPPAPAAAREREGTSPAAPRAPAAIPAARPGARQHRVYFAAVDSAGGIALTGVTRSAVDSAAPLTDTLATLLAGPDASESGRGLITLIPPAVTLNRVYVRERVAYVDVSESFRFNRHGREGLDIQLQQVVYSATQFPNVEQVQILIDGRRIDYLGSEGAFVGEPIGREAFQ